MTTQKVDSFLYWEENLEAIAHALNEDPRSVSLFRSRFDAAANNFLRPPRYFELVPNKRVLKRLSSIEKTAEKIIDYTAALILARGDRLPDDVELDVNDLPRFQPSRFCHQIDKLIDLFCFDEDDLEDGMAGSPIVTALLKPTAKDEQATLERQEDEFVIRNLLQTIKLGENEDPDAVLLAAWDLSKRAKEAQATIENVRKLTLPSVNAGDVVFNVWIDEMLNLYKAITRSPIKTAVGKPGWDNEGIAYGRVIEFLKAAISPLEKTLLEKSILQQPLAEDGWRSRIRTAEKARTKTA